MTNLLDLTPGTVRDGAASCQAIGDRAAALGRVLDHAAVGRWESPAGAAFARDVFEHLAFVRGAADRLIRTARILRRYADALEEAQGRYLVANYEWALADGYAGQLSQVLRSTRFTAADAGLVVVERDHHLAEATKARSVMTSIADEWATTEARFAAELRAVAHDGIRDGDWYRRLHARQRDADKAAMLGMVPGPQQVVTVPLSAWAASTSTVLSVGFKLGYDEGTWKGIAGGIVLNRLKTGAKVLKHGATALPKNGLAPESLTAIERLKIGSKAVAAGTYGGRGVRSASSGAAKVVNPPPTGSMLRRLGAKARQRAEAELDKRYRDDYRIATRNGQVAKRMLLTSWAADGTVKGVNAVDKVRTTKGAYDRWREDRAEARRRG